MTTTRCARCTGTGQYPSTRDDGRCYACDGRGTVSTSYRTAGTRSGGGGGVFRDVVEALLPGIRSRRIEAEQRRDAERRPAAEPAPPPAGVRPQRVPADPPAAVRTTVALIARAISDSARVHLPYVDPARIEALTRATVEEEVNRTFPRGAPGATREQLIELCVDAAMTAVRHEARKHVSRYAGNRDERRMMRLAGGPDPRPDWVLALDTWLGPHRVAPRTPAPEGPPAPGPGDPPQPVRQTWRPAKKKDDDDRERIRIRVC
jgi:hypothetical protein